MPLPNLYKRLFVAKNYNQFSNIVIIMNSRKLDRDDDDPRPFPGPNASRFGAQYKFSAEEMQVLKECNRESFYQRCVPLSAVLGGSVYYAIKTGMLKGNPRFGPTPKVIGAIVVGYFVGKFSYQGKCAAKLMQLPDSQFGEMLRQRKKGGFQESIDSTFGPSMALSPFSSISPSDTYTDVGVPENPLDMDTSRPELSGLDDNHRPSVDNPVYEEEEMPPLQKHATTYDELRKQNREEYQQRRIGYRTGPEPSDTKPEPALPRPRKNKYGDSFD